MARMIVAFPLAVTVLWAFLLASVQCILYQGVAQMSHEKRLIRDLIGNYTLRGKMGRPVREQNDTITIYYGMSLIQILDLDEKNQVLSTNVWATYNWNDMYLAWNESEYGNISAVRVKNEDIWKPDIKLYNYADERLEEKRDALCVLSSNGNVVWIPQAVFKSSCSINIRHFPFDEQNCTLKFGSWTYDGNKLDLQFAYPDTNGFELTDYIESNEWQIINSSASRNVFVYECCPEPYVDLRFTIIIRRKVAFYNYILILPCVLLSSLTLVLFWLPPESPAKMQLGMNIFVAFFVLLLLLAESTPPAAASIPLIGAYYCLNMILITLSTLLSVVIVNLYFHGPGTRVPRIFKRVMLDFFARVFCMRNTLMDAQERQEWRDTKEAEDLALMTRAGGGNSGGGGGGGGGRTANSTANTNANSAYIKNHRDKRHVEFKYDRVGMFEMQPEENWRTFSNGPGSETDLSERMMTMPYQFSQLEAEVREIRRHLRIMMERDNDKSARELVSREWKLVALVLDRLFFFLYLLVLIISAFSLFPKSVFEFTAEETAVAAKNDTAS